MEEAQEYDDIYVTALNILNSNVAHLEDKLGKNKRNELDSEITSAYIEFAHKLKTKNR
mgnify:CR=1 FL=1